VTALFLKIFNGRLFGLTLGMYRPNLKFVALPVPEIIGDAQFMETYWLIIANFSYPTIIILAPLHGMFL